MLLLVARSKFHLDGRRWISIPCRTESASGRALFPATLRPRWNPNSGKWKRPPHSCCQRFPARSTQGFRSMAIPRNVPIACSPCAGDETRSPPKLVILAAVQLPISPGRRVQTQTAAAYDKSGARPGATGAPTKQGGTEER